MRRLSYAIRSSFPCTFLRSLRLLLYHRFQYGDGCESFTNSAVVSLTAVSRAVSAAITSLMVSWWSLCCKDASLDDRPSRYSDQLVCRYSGVGTKCTLA